MQLHLMCFFCMIITVCLDGTLPGYHFDPGFSKGSNNWLISLEGGGWCNNLRTCIFRKTTRHGSSKYFEKKIPFTGILSNKATENPDFYDWNRVKIRYCDGTSFAGDAEDKNKGLQFRGQRIWQASIEELTSKGLRNASHALAGCSAGCLAAILHCDQFGSLFPSTTKVKCMSDAGLFLDAIDVSGGHTLRNLFNGVVTLQGVKKYLPNYCTNHLDPTSEDNNEAVGRRGKGGFRATFFVYALVAMDNMGFVAMMVSLVLYFSRKMYFDLSTSANTLTNLMGSTFLLTVVGGFISDTYINRFLTCIIFGVVEIMALAMMTIQAHNSDLLPPPPPCKGHCLTGGKAVYFYFTLCLLALGVGGSRGALPALGADQFDVKDPKQAKSLASYFNWLLLSSVSGACVGVTVIVWVATNTNNHNWWKGFLIIVLGTFIGYIFLAAGKPFYLIQVPGDSPLIRVSQVIVIALKNRSLPHPVNPNELYETNEKDADSLAAKVTHTEQFRWLDKAAIRPANAEPTSMNVCTVTQVEEVKVLTRMLPIIFSTIIMNTCLAQLQTFSVAQGYIMDPHLGSFKVPASSIPVIPLLFMVILIPLYDRVFVPFVRKFTNHPSGITQLQRVGVGLVLSALSMSIAALVEVKRRHRSLKEPMQPISLFWLSFQYGVFGIADMFTLVGLLEFFYKEAPAGMKSLSTSFTWISLSLGYFLSTVLVDVINSVTRQIAPSKKGWLHGQDLNQNNLNLFYWFLSILSILNFFHYLYWAMWYKYKNVGDEADDKAASSLPQSVSMTAVPFLKTGAAGVEHASNSADSVDGAKEKD